jgi:hypothetical protein
MGEKTKIVTISGQKYQIRKLRANVGSFILTRILAAGVSAGSLGIGDNPKESLLMSVFGAFLRGLDFETFSFIQNNCLSVISRMEAGADGGEDPMPIVADSGVFAAPDVASNLPLLMNLTMQSLMFNLADFFEEGGLNAMLGK